MIVSIAFATIRMECHTFRLFMWETAIAPLVNKYVNLHHYKVTNKYLHRGNKKGFLLLKKQKHFFPPTKTPNVHKVITNLCCYCYFLSCAHVLLLTHAL